MKLFKKINLSNGIKENDKFVTLIEKNERISCGKKHIFKTLSDNQTSILVELYEGENLNNKENNLFISQYKIDGLSKKKAGEVSIEVKFEIDDNTMLEVKAWEKSDKSSINNLKITKLNELDMKSLETKIYQISFAENEEFNQIKFDIIELEEKITKQNTQYTFNAESIKLLYNNILKKIWNFLQENKEYSNLFISFYRY